MLPERRGGGRRRCELPPAVFSHWDCAEKGSCGVAGLCWVDAVPDALRIDTSGIVEPAQLHCRANLVRRYQRR